MALKEKYEGEIRFIIADVDDFQGAALAQQFEVSTIPAIFILDRQGKTVYEIVGPESFGNLSGKIEDVLENKSFEQTGLDKFFYVTIPDAISKGLLITFLLVFIGGLVTSISPCTFSMIPLVVGYIGGYSKPTKTKGFFLALLFVFGLSTTFAILGIVAALLGQVFGQFGALFYLLMAFAAIIMGLNLLGIIQLTLPGLKGLPATKEGYLGAYLTGLFFGLVASPCATPVLAVVMAYVATQGDLIYGGILLFVYGLGHGIPLLVVGTFTATLKNIEGFQKRTGYVTYISGAVLVLVGLYFLYTGL